MTAFHGDQGQKMVYLVRYWNTEFINLARTWPGSELYVLGLEDWIAENIRTQQLFNLGLANTDGSDSQLSEFTNVSNPCLWVTQIPPDKVTLIHRCELPALYLV